jgi:hypothetical protein
VRIEISIQVSALALPLRLQRSCGAGIYSPRQLFAPTFVFADEFYFFSPASNLAVNRLSGQIPAWYKMGNLTELYVMTSSFELAREEDLTCVGGVERFHGINSAASCLI